MSEETAAFGTATILIVDDAPETIEPIVSCLRAGPYRTRIATSGERALELAQVEPLPDLILLDVMMPGINGYDVCRQLKANPRTLGIPVIFLTVRTDAADEQQGFDVGAVDYITKPISPPIVKARVRTHLTLKAASDFLTDRNAFLENEIDRRINELNAVQEATIVALASLAETRDAETGNHIRRTQLYVKALADQLKRHPRFAAELTDEAIYLMYKSAPLHDIGKVGIPDSILLKPGPLDDEEWAIMKTHTTLGREALEAAEAALGTEVSFLRFAKEIAQSHQEKWDGSGYPEGLAGELIPISARLMAVADVYDALISERVYKKAYSHEEAVSTIVAGKDAHFDPDVVDAFVHMADVFRQIAVRFADA
ncbi:two-component system response regulator [Nitrogeniibacter mangrovi]|uniref:Two-component system response regulator n=1 Tax=Nitrogeniibacter mangrovi TaxID=2016596 RepID=A0A6C1BA79_9RHOO|nr:two-component system response regulator [Nitrogeniibacter mangrovi]QID19598.1 two-component system response regulator [Nitrogeniibacter mangrovi]